MNLSTTSDESEKVWDHPWTTDEMRQYRSNWSLASDVGLLRHLQQFSEDLTTTVKNTKSTLDLLNSQLNETTVLIDNVTNASLALANTQFIESRVYEDDINSERQQANAIQDDKSELPDNDIMNETEMMIAIGENIQRGLGIMDEKYERLEVISSDSEEDDIEIPQSSFILKPKDPYQNRPLPYVIDSDKWKSSSKIGLESSSSESEISDKDDDDDNNDDDDGTENDKDMDELSQHIFIENSRRISILRRSSSSSSESSDFNESSITNKHNSETSSQTNNKLYSRSQDTLNSTSEITTPTVGLSRGDENFTRNTPSFAEELANRLGSVLPTNKKHIDKHDRNQASINPHAKNDLFTKDENKNDNDDEDIFNTKSDNLFSGGDGLFDDDNDDDDEAFNDLWKNKSIIRPQTNIIPPSMDIPPPMHFTETKPKSAFDDLFGDSDSGNDDDIFAPRISNNSEGTKSTNVVNKHESKTYKDVVDNALILAINNKNNDKIATSTPETNNNVLNLFEDDDDDKNLFNSKLKSTNHKKSPESSRKFRSDRTPGILLSQPDLLSSSLGSRLFQQTHQESSDSSETESVEHQPDATKHEDDITGIDENTSNMSTLQSSEVQAGNRNHPDTSDSSGISIHPQSMNSTLSLGGTNNWVPQMESTRLPSEELYRDRVTSDSLLNPQTHQQNNSDLSTNTNISVPPLSNRVHESSNVHVEDLFENDDDVFSPPPLPKNKIKSESKVTSLFDDSDSGDDLFSNTSSGSRSQKSADILTNLTQQQSIEKSKSGLKQSGIFNEGVDNFSSKVRSTNVDISTPDSTLKNKNYSSKQSQLPVETSKIAIETFGDVSKKLTTSLSQSTGIKTTSIFDNNETEDEDIFGSIIPSKFNDENNFFATSSVQTPSSDVLVVPKKDLTAEVAGVRDNKESRVKSENYNRANSQKLTTNKISSRRVDTAIGNTLFDDSSDDNDDSLFSRKNPILSQVKSRQEKLKPVIQVVEPDESSMASTDKSNEVEITHSKDDEQNINESITVKTQINKHVKNSSHEIHTKEDSSRCLKIRLPTAGTSEDPNLPPRRAVSGKIKNLMGKMGDLKILSPTDTPLQYRKSNENLSSDDDDDTLDHDSEDGSSVSIPSHKFEPPLPKEKIMKKKLLQSPTIEIETAVSFDIPAQADTLTVTASKSRVRIPAKRRPQSRHARQSALRTSGIDFDTVDAVIDNSSDVIEPKETERLVISNDDGDGAANEYSIKSNKRPINFISDDKSEISLGKESSISITKNTLLSPSTDEEDLFDVPPDLPDDSQKEDSLFARAPILSPVHKPRQKNTEHHFINESDNSEIERNTSINKLVKNENLKINEEFTDGKTDYDNAEQLIDPLHDGNHDPLKDPSQLFAFVTKTPSPEKSKVLLFNEDSSLFSQTMKKTSDDAECGRKSSFDIFASDSNSDLFSGPFTKATTKSSMKGTKNNLFNDLDSDDDVTDELFGSASSKRSNQSKSDHSDIDTNEVSNAFDNSPKRIDIFDDDDEDLFFDASEKPSLDTGKDDQLFSATSKVTKAKLEDIFGDPSSGEDDIFSIKKSIGRGTTAGKLFFDVDKSDNTTDIFAKKPSSSTVTTEPLESQITIKKAITRDLRKTAEQIVKDPLSMLHDD